MKSIEYQIRFQQLACRHLLEMKKPVLKKIKLKIQVQGTHQGKMLEINKRSFQNEISENSEPAANL